MVRHFLGSEAPSWTILWERYLGRHGVGVIWSIRLRMEERLSPWASQMGWAVSVAFAESLLADTRFHLALFRYCSVPDYVIRAWTS